MDVGFIFQGRVAGDSRDCNLETEVLEILERSYNRAIGWKIGLGESGAKRRDFSSLKPYRVAAQGAA